MCVYIPLSLEKKKWYAYYRSEPTLYMLTWLSYWTLRKTDRGRSSDVSHFRDEKNEAERLQNYLNLPNKQ